jgi:predicted nucleotidyltransferase
MKVGGNPMPVQIGIDPEAIRDLCRRHHVRRLSLFGSVLRDDFRPDSDVDLLVEFLPGHQPGLALFEMEEELEKILDRRVDLLTPGFLGAPIRAGVLQEAQAIYVAS